MDGNLLDIAVIAVLVLFVAAGVYRGFFCTALSLGAYLLSCLLAFLLMPLVSGLVTDNTELYNTMLYYTEGSEFVQDVALSRTSISSLSSEQLGGVISHANLPNPMGERISENIAKETFASQGIDTLGDYFNQTIVNVFINILSFLVVFAILRLLLAFVIHGVDYARGGYPQLQRMDGVIAGAVGLIRGFLALFVVFMLAPICVIVLSQAEAFISESVFGGFFYQSNFLLSLIPGA